MTDAAATALIDAGVPAEAAQALRRHGRPFTAPAGHVLFRPGDLCPGFVALARGLIRVSLAAESGRSVTLYRVAPGELCLQTFQHLVDGAVYSAEGLVEAPLAGVIVPPDAFERMMSESAAIRRYVLGQVAERFDLIVRSFEDTAFHSLEQRLARALLHSAQDGVVAATHAELAAEIGSSREVVSRQMRRWVAAGLARTARGRTELALPALLRDIAGGAV